MTREVLGRPRFVIDRSEAQPIADSVKFWVREVATDRVDVIVVSFYDAADVDAAATLAIEEMSRRVDGPKQ